MRVDLTKSVTDSLTCPRNKRDAVFFDAKLRGFVLRVTESGAKIFLVQYNRAGKTKKFKIGTYGVLTPAQARRRALEVIAGIQAGADPLEARKNARLAAEEAEAEQKQRAAEREAADAFTVSALLDTWATIKLKTLSANYRREGPRAVRYLLGDLAQAPAASLTTAAVQLIVDREIDRVPVQVINACAYGRAAWSWAMKRGLVAMNPFAGVVIERRVKSRDRVRTDTEIGEVWRAASLQAFPFGPIIRLLMLTLQRVSEVSGMGWSEISDDLSTWTIPATRAKNKRGHLVHLAEPAKEILREMRAREAAAEIEAKREGREIPETDLIFTTTYLTPSSGIGKARRALDALIEAERAEADIRQVHSMPAKNERRSQTGWRLHDFRRTGVSKLAELGIPPHVADRVLNHVTGAIQGVAAVYQRFEFLPERKRALDVWATHVLALAKGAAPESNVLTLPSGLDKARNSST